LSFTLCDREMCRAARQERDRLLAKLAVASRALVAARAKLVEKGYAPQDEIICRVDLALAQLPADSSSDAGPWVVRRAVDRGNCEFFSAVVADGDLGVCPVWSNIESAARFPDKIDAGMTAGAFKEKWKTTVEPLPKGSVDRG
jgi:hypothetical protein